VVNIIDERLCAMAGCSREELLEKSTRILYPTDEDFEFVEQEKYAQISKQATEVLQRGCDGFIQKPFSMIDLSQKIREILDKD
jgi:hypothetical protein